tara:strand:+ start:22821 stop:23099 length:279 start_codon:yes stop_codon:yes gene_type:complete
VLAPSRGLNAKGAIKAFHDIGDNGNEVIRQFCPDCGSALFSVLPASPSTIAIKAGTLDDTSWLTPAAQIWCDSAQPWLDLNMKVKFPRDAPR